MPATLALGGASHAGAGHPLLPDLRQEPPSGLIVTPAGSPAHPRWLLGFRSAVSNVGAGPLIIDGARSSAGRRTMAADQVIVSVGAPRALVRGVGQLRYVRSPDHRHWHLLRFDRYELRRAGSDRALARDRKTGFCLGDRYAAAGHTLAVPPRRPRYVGRCGLDRPGLLGIREGISVGYGDDYTANLEGQYLPLDGLRSGRYVLVHEVNASHALRESSYANNASSMLLRLRRVDGVPRLRILRTCPASDRCAAAR